MKVGWTAESLARTRADATAVLSAEWRDERLAGSWVAETVAMMVAM